MADMGIAIGGATATPGVVRLPGSSAIRLTVRSVGGMRHGRARYALDPSDPNSINGGKEVIGARFTVGPGGLVVNQNLNFGANPDAGIILVNIFVAELDANGNQVGEEDGTSVTLGAL